MPADELTTICGAGKRELDTVAPCSSANTLADSGVQYRIDRVCPMSYRPITRIDTNRMPRRLLEHSRFSISSAV